MISPQPSGRRAWRRHAWLFPTALGIIAIVFLCWGAWRYGYDPHWLTQSHAWYRVALQPDQSVTLAATLALWVAGLSCYWWPRRRQRLPTGLIVVVVMVFIAAGLGSASYVPCRGQVSTLGVTFWILQLYVGQPPNIYQSVLPATAPPYACVGPPPLALQLGQMVGLGATLIGAVAVAALLWRQPLERLRSRFAREVTVFTGLDALTLPLLNRLTGRGKPGSVIVIEPDETHPLLDEARATGARVIIGEPVSARLLQPIISGWRGCVLNHLYAMRGEVADNDAMLKVASEILRRYPPAPGHLPHLVARIDDPRHANSWRGSRGGISVTGLEDALSPAETTAYALVDAMLQGPVRQLILCGDSNLTIAVLAELDRRGWEARELAKAAAAGRQVMQAAAASAGPPPPLGIRRVVLIDPKSGDTRREYQAGASQEAVGAFPALAIREGRWQDELLPALDAMSPTTARETAVVIVEGFSEAAMHAAGRVARLHPGTQIYMQASSGDGISGPVFDQLRLFRLGLLVEGHVPEDTWTRIARHWHEYHRLESPVPPGHPKAPSRAPWADLDEFVRQDNILQVRSIMSAVAALGRQWVPVRMLRPGSFIELTDRELELVAKAEHTRWYRRQVAFGMSNELAVPWPDLSAGRQAAAREEVRTQIAQLKDVGFAPIVPVGGPADARSFERVGMVEAKRLSAPLRWAIRSGEQMRGDVGDWRVIDDLGEVRTVTDPEFQASHEPADDGQWRRVGTFRAWRASEPLVVRTKEGISTADRGDWVVEGQSGERWPVKEGQFQRTYRPVKAASDAGFRDRPGRTE